MLLLDDLLQVVEVQSCMYPQAGPVQLCYWYSSNSTNSITCGRKLSPSVSGRGGGRGRGRGGARIEENALSLWFSGVESVGYIAKQMF